MAMNDARKEMNERPRERDAFVNKSIWGTTTTTDEQRKTKDKRHTERAKKNWIDD